MNATTTGPRRDYLALSVSQLLVCLIGDYPDKGEAMNRSVRRGRVLAALIGFLGDFDRAEEATQEAFAIAARALSELMPEEPEVHGLLALMLLHDSRRAAREQEGALVLLRRLGRNVEVRTACQRALALVHDEVERRLLERRLADLAGPRAAGPGMRAPPSAAGARGRSSYPRMRWATATGPPRSAR